MNAERSSSSNSSTVYNEPFSDLDVGSFRAPSKIDLIAPAENNTSGKALCETGLNWSLIQVAESVRTKSLT